MRLILRRTDKVRPPTNEPSPAWGPDDYSVFADNEIGRIYPAESPPGRPRRCGRWTSNTSGRAPMVAG
jgi:hypothetical protein